MAHRVPMFLSFGVEGLFGFGGVRAPQRSFRLPPRRNDRVRVKRMKEPTRDHPKTQYFYRTYQADSLTAFDIAGTLQMSNTVLESRPCERSKKWRPSPCLHCRGGPEIVPFDVNFVRKASRRSGPREAAAGSAGGRPQKEPAEAAVRDLFPETFLFQLEGLGANDKAKITTNLPDTITSWSASAFCSGVRSGFGLSESATITTFKPFFIQMPLPYSVKRGEVLPVRISIFNYNRVKVSVSVKLSKSQDYTIDGNGSSTQEICVEANKISVVEFPVTFSKLGDVMVTVSATTGDATVCGARDSVSLSDAVKRRLVVKPEGFPQEEVSSAFVCRGSASDPATVERFELAEPDHLVPGSQRAWVSIVGDLLAPSKDNLERLVRVPTGCGEQNMITFVPNIAVHRYLKQVDLLTEGLRHRTTANMLTGYQRELRFRRRDGSYSAFPERSPPRYKGSLWLTAFVVRSYVAASSYISIDTADLVISTRWIISKQKASGAFERYGDLFHKEMTGGVLNGAEEALTAYVVKTLLDVSSKLKAGSEAMQIKNAMDRAVRYLKASSDYNTLYAEILVANTLVAAGERQGETRVNTLLGKGTRDGGQLYWMGDRSGPVGGSRAVDVEMTSYMVLSLLQLGGSKYLAEAALAVKWINAQRNSQGGFVSTQDTVVALMALTEFAMTTYSPDAAVKVNVMALQNFQLYVQITPSTRLLTLQKRLPSPLQLPNTVTFKIGGEGCALTQSVLRYNTKVAFPDPKFNLHAKITEVKPTCAFSLKVCTSFKEPNKKSNMALVEIEMVSGFLTVDSSLRKLKTEGVIERWEFKDGMASLYFKEFTATEVCFEVLFVRAVQVEKLKPAIVRVYDYYAPEDRFEVEYGPPACP